MKVMATISVFVLLGLSGCDSLAGIAALNCAPPGTPGVTLSIVDSTTGEVVDGDIIALATDGEYADTVRLPHDGQTASSVWLANDRPGIYRVEVQAAGYEPWSVAPVLIPDDGCQIKGVSVTASLQRMESP